MGDDDNEGHYDNYFDTKPWYIWISYMMTTILTFWLQAMITEDRFVPTLNVIAHWLQIPDDVAGATIMAGGASTPELFGSFVALFVTHSSLGIGTIVGSAIFNHLVICAGAVLAARGNELQLNPIILWRETIFYALAILVLLYSLSKKEIVDDDVNHEPHIRISILEGGLLLFGYFLYVIVCAKFDHVLLLLKKLYLFPAIMEPYDNSEIQKSTNLMDKENWSRMTTMNKIKVPKMPFMRYIANEPKHNFHDETSISGNSDSSQEVDSCAYELDSTKPSDLHGIDSIEIKQEEGKLSCFLWQQSIFYNKARIDVKAWQLRWFTFSSQGIESKTEKTKTRKSRTYKYPLISKVEVDEDHLLLKLHRMNSKRQPYILMTPNRNILVAVVEVCDEMLKSVCTKNELESPLHSNLDITENHYGEKMLSQEHRKDEHHNSLIAYPNNESLLQKIMFFLLFPLKLLVHLTIPDVRLEVGINDIPFLKTFFSMLMCIIWIIISSYILVESLEEIGRLLNIPEAIIGITISAAGTSVANFVASQCAARQGLGNMAVSNAFGSNSFIIFVGLGLPWLMFCITEEGGEPYYELRDEGLTESVILMGIFLLLFMVLVWLNNYTLRTSHAYVFLIGYTLYIIGAGRQCYLQTH